MGRSTPSCGGTLARKPPASHPSLLPLIPCLDRGAGRGSYLFPMPRTVARPSTPATVVATATYAAPPQLPLAEAGMAPAV